MENEPASTQLAVDLFQMVDRTQPKSVKLEGNHTNGNAIQANMNRFDGNLAHGNIETTTTTNVTIPQLVFVSLQEDNVSSLLCLVDKARSSANSIASLNGVALDSPSAELDPVEMPSLVPSMTNRVYERLDQARKDKRREMTTKSKEIIAIYEDILDQYAAATINFGRIPRCLETIEQDIIEQKLRFEVTNTSLLNSMSVASLGQSKSSILRCGDVLDQIKSISLVLKDAPGHFDKIFNDFKVNFFSIVNILI